MHVRSTVGLHQHPIRSGALCLAVVALSLTACSSSGSGKTGGSSSASSTGSAAASGSSGSTPSGTPITIGIVAAETGAYGAYGLGDEKGIEAQIDLINASGGILGHPLKLDNIDDQSDPSKAVIGVQKLLSENPPPLMMHCGAISADCAPMLPYTGRAKVITMTPAATPAFADPSQNPYNFVVFPGADIQTSARVAALKQVGSSSVGLLSATDTGDKAILAADQTALPAAGIKIVKSVTVDPTAIDFTAQLQALRSAGVTTIAAEVQATNYVTLMKNIQSIGWKDVKVVAGTTAVADTVLGAIPSAVADQFVAIGVHTVSRTGSDISSLAANEQTLIKKMQELNSPFNALNGATIGADEVSLIKWAAEKANSVDPAAIYKELEGLNLSVQIPDGTFISLPHPDWSSTNHGLKGADLSKYWALIKPGTSVTGTWVGEPLSLSAS